MGAAARRAGAGLAHPRADYRGLGESRGAGDATTMEVIAEDVLGLLRQLGVRRAAVAGLSMGGYAALELYRRAPKLFRGFALCDTKAAPDTEAQKDVREQFAKDAVAKGLDLGGRQLHAEAAAR